MPRDYYEVLGVSRGRRRRRDQEGVPAAGPRAASRRQQPRSPRPRRSSRRRPRPTRSSSDPERRATYDRYGHEGLRSGGYAPNFEGFGSVADIFEAFFGGGGVRRRVRRRQPVRRRRWRDPGRRRRRQRRDRPGAGGPRRLGRGRPTRRSSLCEHCRGNGAEPGTPIETCPRCDGTGQLRAVSRTPFGQVVRAATCDVCHGDGKVPREPVQGLQRAGAQGRALEGRRRRPGGHRRRAADPDRRARPRRRARRTGRRPLRPDPGRARTPRFVRDGDDLVTAVDVAAPLAALGTTVEVPTVDGTVELEIPAGTQPHETLDGARARGCRRSAGAATATCASSSTWSSRATSVASSASCSRSWPESLTDHNLRTDEGVFGKISAPSAAERTVIRLAVRVRRERRRARARRAARAGPERRRGGRARRRRGRVRGVRAAGRAAGAARPAGGGRRGAGRGHARPRSPTTGRSAGGSSTGRSCSTSALTVRPPWEPRGAGRRSTS